MDNELTKALELYKSNFDDDFPTIPLAISRADKEVIAIINECIEKKKDVYELGYLTLETDVLY